MVSDSKQLVSLLECYKKQCLQVENIIISIASVYKCLRQIMF